MILAVEFPRHPIRAQPHERGCKSLSLSLHGCSGIANEILLMAEVLQFPLPTKFRMSQIEAFDGTKDPVDHLNTYKNQMELHGYQDPVRCQAFSIMLKGSTLAWLNRLSPASISSFKELSIAFMSHLIGARTYRKPSYHLLTIKQGPQENLRSYVQRFNLESLRVDIPDEKFAITAFIARLGTQSKDLMFSISKNPQATMAEVLAKAKNTSMARRPLCLSGEALPLERRKARTRKRGTEAPGDEETETYLHGGVWKTEIDLQREEVTSGTTWVHPILSCSRGTHLSNSPP